MNFVSKVAIFTEKNTQIKSVLQILASSLFIALCAQISIPIPGYPVPITGQTFAVLLVGCILGRYKGVMAVVAYLTEVLLGLPVLASGISYPLALIGSHAGYLFGFIPMAYLAGWFMEQQKSFNTMKTFTFMLVCPSLIQLLLGTAWLGNFVGWENAFIMGFNPFVAGAIVKCLGLTAYLNSQKSA